MKIVTVLFVFLLSISSFSQKKHADGPYELHYDNGVLKIEGVYKNNKKIGDWKSYYDNGQLKSVNNYSNYGKRTGVEESYSKKGVLISDTKPTEKGGLLVKKYYSSGKLLAVYKLIRNNNKRLIKDGAYNDYYENGVLKTESLYLNNQLSGVWRQYYETGDKEWEVSYVNGLKEGFYKQFYKNGQLKVEGLHVMNLKNGEEKSYNEDGDSIRILKYKKGNLKKANKGLDTVLVPDGAFERVPLFPGCEKVQGNKEKRKCMSTKLSKFIAANFNTDLASNIGLAGRQRIDVIFKIDKTGKVTGIRAKAKHQVLKAEAIRVVSLLPMMIPGEQFGKKVNVPYSLPIIFQVQSKKKSNTYYSPYSVKKKF